MSQFFRELEQQEGKQAYQAYEIMHGIERINALIPLKLSRSFEESLKRLQSKPALLEAITRHSGRVS